MKAILVIDLPKNCCECELSVTDSICEYCAITETLIQNTFEESEDELKRNNDCPLRPMPLKRNQSEELADTRGFDMYMEGWNDCLKELEK